MSDERISQLRRFLAGRRGQKVTVPETEVPHAVPVGNTGMILAIAEGSSGGFGARMWPSAKTIVNQIAMQAWPRDLRGKNVLELGCGVGMAGLAAGAVGARVLLTDRDAAVLERAEANLHLNASLVPSHALPCILPTFQQSGSHSLIAGRCCDAQIQREGGKATVEPLKWGDEKSMQRLLAQHGPFDFILGSDILYSRAAYGDLLRTITFFSQPHTRTWLSCPRRDEGLGEGYGGKYFASGKGVLSRQALLILGAALYMPRRAATATAGVATRLLLPVDRHFLRLLVCSCCASAVAAGITVDEDVAKGRKMEHTAFALDPGCSV